MKGFFIEVSNNLLDAKHRMQMGEAVWLFMWLLDKITTVTEEKGKVLGGKPIKFSDLEKDLGISRSTYLRWLEILKKYGYVTTVRTPYGNCIVVLKAKKRFNKKPEDESKKITVRSVKDETSGCVKDETTGCIKDETSGCVKDETSLSRNDTSLSIFDTSNKTVSVDSTEDSINTNPSEPAGSDGMAEEWVGLRDGSFTKKVKDIRLYESEKEVPHAMASEIVASFLPIFPAKFAANDDMFKMKTNYAAVKGLLMLLTPGAIKDVINKYIEKKSDRFRPEVYNIPDFCKKFAKIEAYVNKSAGGLWAQRSISTPEESKVRDDQYQKVIDAAEARMQKAKEKWEREHPDQNHGK